MEKFRKWIKEKFKKDPMKVTIDEIKQDQLKIDRLACIKRDEIEDADENISNLLQKCIGQSIEMKDNLAVEIEILNKKKMQLQKEHENLMDQKSALNMLEFIVMQKSDRQLSTIANLIFDMDVSGVSDIAIDTAINDMTKKDKLKKLEDAIVGMYGREQTSEEKKQILEMLNDLEAGEIGKDECLHELEKSAKNKLIIWGMRMVWKSN